MLRTAIACYDRIVLGRPVATLLMLALFTLGLGWFAQDFGLDASADSLTLEGDEDLGYYRTVRAQYGSDDYLIVTFTPTAELFSDPVLERLRELRDALAALPGVESVVSILDVPLIASPPVALRDIGSGVRTLSDPDTDRNLARVEFLDSALYRDLIISSDGQTTALRVDFRQDEEYLRLLDERNRLRVEAYASDLSPEEEEQLEMVSAAFKRSSRAQLAREQRNIAAVRDVIEAHNDGVSVHLGGVPMIVADSVAFIRHDLIVFGLAVVFFLVVILSIAFRKPRWVLLSLTTCLATCLIMLGFLGLTRWQVTVVSSNFLSLLLILCLALTLHIIVRYRETHALNPDWDQAALVRETVRRIGMPCFYTAVTTMVAFGSLVVSGIRPVIDFGWMMVIGLAVAFVLAFMMFPAGLMLLEPGPPASRRDVTAAITGFFARLISRYPRVTLVIFALVSAGAVAGITQLTVENRFIDYYRQSTEIYQGMELIDRRLGGTTPLDVIIDAPEEPVTALGSAADTNDAYDADDELLEFFEDEGESDAGITVTSHWFNGAQLPEVIAIHDYLDGLPETGKVVSIATLAKILGELDPTVLDDDLYLSIVYKRLPEEVRAALVSPYMSDDGDQLRFSIRVFESDPTLRREQLLDKIRHDLVADLGVSDEQVHLSGMLVLYNNMLQSLYRSQILTLGAVFLAIMVMFLILFRSLKLAATAIIPNVVSAVLVLGLMGWAGIPLDLMTITIAAITIGIAVDDTIHYVHRFQHEFSKDHDYWAAIGRCHQTIGRAMYYTSVTIMLGFSILAMSQFIPTIYFGLLIGLAMLVALLADLTLLPVLLATFRACDRRSPALR